MRICSNWAIGGSDTFSPCHPVTLSCCRLAKLRKNSQLCGTGVEESRAVKTESPHEAANCARYMPPAAREHSIGSALSLLVRSEEACALVGHDLEKGSSRMKRKLLG